MSRYTILPMPITIYRGAVFEEYVYIPSDTGAQDLTGVVLSAVIYDKPGGNTIATMTCNADIAPPDLDDGTGWVQIRLDNSETTAISTAYHRGYWVLTASLESDNPNIVAAGSAEIVSLI